ncbi:MAG: polyprenyl synthetase family protein [Candidatus Helarchaeota archaeon]
MNLQDYLKIKTPLINSAIQEHLRAWNFPEPLNSAISHILETGGKRIRPILTLLSCESVGGTIRSVLCPAISIELIHNASLLWDDVIDQDDLRRGKITVHKKWDKNIALLAGGILASKALELISETPEIFELYSKAIGKMIEGQVLDISQNLNSSNQIFESKNERELFEILRTRFREKALEGLEWEEGSNLHLIADFTEFEEEREYFEMVAYKTSSLIKLATRVCAILGNGSQQQITALTNFGFYLGIAFQVRDDIIDVVSVDKISGKPMGSDIRQGKLNLYTIYALRNLENTKLGEFLKLLQNAKFPSDFYKIREILIDSGALEYTKEKLNLLVFKAKEELAALTESPSKNVLYQLIDFISERNY